MQGAPSGGVAAEAAALPRVRLRRPAETLVLGTALVVLAAAVLRGGGSSAGPLLLIGGAAALAAAGGAAAVLAGALARPRPGRAGSAFAGLLAGFAAWSAVTIVWSVEPDRSWDSFNRVAAYVALVGLGMLAGAVVRDAPRAAVGLLGAVLAAAIVWALVTAAVPGLGPEVDRSARLREPVGYWNALALAVAMSLPLWLWASSRPAHRPTARALGVVALFASVVALLLTSSRGGVLVAAVAVLAWLALGRPRLESAAALMLALPPGIAVGAWALSSAVSEAGASSGDRSRAGAWLALALVAVAAAVFALARAGARRPIPPAVGRIAAAGGVAVVLAAAALVAVRADDIASEFRNPPSVQVPDDPSRFEDVSSNHRWTWWTQAWTIFRKDPLGGAGAGAYEMARRPLREDTRAPLEPHNLVLKTLSETGIVGLALLGGALVAAVAVAGGALRRLRGEERMAAAALAAAGAAWLAHSLVDMPWEYVAVSAPLFVTLGVLATAGRESPGPRARAAAPLRLAPAVAALALLASLALPWAAERRLEASVEALLRGDYAVAAEAAAGAGSLNPLAVRPLHYEATAYETLGRLDEAERLYEQAVRLQPRNPQTWYELGRFEFQSRGDLGQALLYLDRSWALDPWPPETGALLDAVRAELAERG